MLSDEGNAGDGEKTIGLISKKPTLHLQHSFFFFNISLPLFCTTTT